MQKRSMPNACEGNCMFGKCMGPECMGPECMLLLMLHALKETGFMGGQSSTENTQKIACSLQRDSGNFDKKVFFTKIKLGGDTKLVSNKRRKVQ